MYNSSQESSFKTFSLCLEARKALGYWGRGQEKHLSLPCISLCILLDEESCIPSPSAHVHLIHSPLRNTAGTVFDRCVGTLWLRQRSTVIELS